jgi:hypothetical protein
MAEDRATVEKLIGLLGLFPERSRIWMFPFLCPFLFPLLIFDISRSHPYWAGLSVASIISAFIIGVSFGAYETPVLSSAMLSIAYLAGTYYVAIVAIGLLIVPLLIVKERFKDKNQPSEQ